MIDVKGVSLMRGGILIGLALLLSFLAGCGGGKGLVGHDAASGFAEVSGVKLAGKKKNVPPPTISNVSVNPTLSEFFGQVIHVQADAKAKRKKDVLTVNAVITRRSDAQTFTVPMSKVKGKTFAADFDAPANTKGTAEVYDVVISATDNRPGSDRPATASAGIFSVRGVALPPPPG
jgi:hypothetical protein